MMWSGFGGVVGWWRVGGVELWGVHATLTLTRSSWLAWIQWCYQPAGPPTAHRLPLRRSESRLA